MTILSRSPAIFYKYGVYAKNICDPQYNQVALLLHMDDVVGPTTFTDLSSSPKTITVSGSAQVNIANFKFGNGSLKTLSSPNNSGLITQNTGFRLITSQPWTIEFWVYFNTIGSSQYFFTSIYNPAGIGVWFYIDFFGKLTVYVLGNEWNLNLTVTTGVWYHIALVHTGIPGSGSSGRFFLNGQLVGYSNITISQPFDQGWFIGGADTSTVGSKPSPDVLIDEVRITQGYARYSVNFPIQTSEYVSDANTSLLLHFDAIDGSTTFTDSSSNNLSVTRSGTTTISTAESKFGGSSLRIQPGNSLNVQASTSLTLTSDFTIEFWIYLNSFPIVEGYPIGWSGGQYTSITHQGRVTITSLNTIQTNINVIGLDVWHHVAICREGTITSIYVDGIARATSITLGNFGSGSSPVYINSFSAGNGAVFDGYIDEIRISNIARYSLNFTPPTAQFGSTQCSS